MENTPDTDRILLKVDQAELRAMIRERAFDLSLLRMEKNEQGSPEDDWCQAAAEIEPFVVVEPSN